MIDNIFACKERKKHENIELSNVQTQKSKDFDAEDRMLWIEKNGTWEKINAAQSIDSPIVNIIQGNNKEVVLQWNYGDDYVPQQQKEITKVGFQVEQTKQIDYKTIEKEDTSPANQTMQTKKAIECIIFFKIILWLSCLGLSAAVMMALNGTSLQEVFRCSNVYLLSALPTALYIIATSNSMKGENQSVRPMNQTMTGQEVPNPTPTDTQANYMSEEEVNQMTSQQTGETINSPSVITAGQNNEHSGPNSMQSQDYPEGNSFYK